MIERRGGAPDRRVGAPDRRRGRPPLTEGERASELTLRLPNAWHDRLAVLASRHELSLSELARSVLFVGLILYPKNGLARERCDD